MQSPLAVEIIPEHGRWRVQKPGHLATTIYSELGAALDDAASWATGRTLVRIVVHEPVPATHQRVQEQRTA